MVAGCLLIRVYLAEHKSGAGLLLGVRSSADHSGEALPLCGFFVCGNGAAKLAKSHVRLLHQKVGRYIVDVSHILSPCAIVRGRWLVIGHKNSRDVQPTRDCSHG